MITAVFFLVAALLINLVAGLFNRFPIPVPTGVADGIEYFFNAFSNFASVFPVSDALVVILFLLAVYWRVYLFKIILWGVGFLPWVGGNRGLPHASSPGDKGAIVDLRAPASKGVIDLRKGRIRTKYRTMSDIRKSR